MVTVEHTFDKDNTCIWSCIKSYYSSGIEVLEQNEDKNGNIHVKVKAKSLKAWDTIRRAANR